MANTYTQIHIQAVFVVMNRESLLHDSWKQSLFRYISGIITTKGHKSLAVNGASDHVHLMMGLRPCQSVSSIIQDIKTNSSKWINDQKYIRGLFRWQEGYGAFSYSKKDVNTVIRYIINQEEHHRKQTLLEEYENLLREFEIEYDERYLFKNVNS